MERDEKLSQGVNKEFLKALVAEGIEKPQTWTSKETRDLGPRKPESKIQAVLQQWYWDLLENLKQTKFTGDDKILEAPDEDMFDKWFENMGLKEYSHTSQLMDLFNTIARGLHLSPQEGSEEKDFDAIWSRIARRCIDEPEYVEKTADIINDKYPGLATPFRSTPTTEEMQEYEDTMHQQKVDKAISKIESNIDEFQDELRKIEAAVKTDFEMLARQLNETILFGADSWELILYNIMSPFAPRIIINNLDYRQNVHMMLAGDISTAKSKVLKIAKMIAPKMVIVDETTKPTFEGVAPTRSGEKIEEGIIDWANDGVMIVEEFTAPFAKIPLFRRVMDGEFIQIFKKGSRKGMYPNSTMLTACNPEEDFFQAEIKLREQLPFKEGVLSRFDILIPLAATQLHNEMIADKLDLFGRGADNPIDFADVRERLMTLSIGMKQIRRVTVTEEQKQTLIETFKEHNAQDKRTTGGMLKNRPLVILRDLETLARFVNVIATVNFSKRKVDDGMLHATDEDVEKAIQLWENLLQFRIQLYARTSRILMSVSDEMIAYLAQIDASKTWVSVDELKQRFVEERGMIKRSTFFKEINGLIEAGSIIVQGERNRTVKLVVK